jgi:hypothetical protein
MKKNYSLFIALLSPAVFVLFFAGTLYHGGSPGGKTGSPGDNGSTCTACHSGTANNVDAWITTDIPELGYVVGETYTITATGTHAGVGRFGFELTAEDQNGNKVGQFSVSPDGQTQFANGNHAITHTSSGITPDGDTKSWSFQWTAPDTDLGIITFYASFNAANANGGTSGDIIYLSSLSVDESSIGIQDNIESIEFTMSPNPSFGQLAISHQLSSAQLQIVELSGKIVYSNQAYHSNDQIDLHYLQQGIYLVQLKNGPFVNTKKLLIK